MYIKADWRLVDIKHEFIVCLYSPLKYLICGHGFLLLINLIEYIFCEDVLLSRRFDAGLSVVVFVVMVLFFLFLYIIYRWKLSLFREKKKCLRSHFPFFNLYMNCFFFVFVFYFPLDDNFVCVIVRFWKLFIENENLLIYDSN